MNPYQPPAETGDVAGLAPAARFNLWSVLVAFAVFAVVLPFGGGFIAYSAMTASIIGMQFVVRRHEN